MTDVTGFGLGGHLIEMCRASNTTAQLEFDELPLVDPKVNDYINAGCIPGGTNRNYESYGGEIKFQSEKQRTLLCDPQTSGGLLIAVAPEQAEEVKAILQLEDLWYKPIGIMQEQTDFLVVIK